MEFLIFPVINTNLITLHKSENIREMCENIIMLLIQSSDCQRKSLFNTNIDVQLILITKKTTDFEYILGCRFYNSNLGEGLINKGLNILCNSFSEKIYNLLNSKINFSSQKSNSNVSLFDGILFKKGEFKSFEFYKTSIQIQRLENDYSEFSFRTIEDLAVEINTTEEKFTDKDNSLYIPFIVNKEFSNKYNTSGQNCVSELHDVKIKHHNICQVILNSKLIDSKFAAFFLNSKLGYEYRKLRQLVLLFSNFKIKYLQTENSYN